MGFNTQRGDETSGHSNATTYLGSDSIFGSLLGELGRSYGTQRSMADLISGGKRYGEARRFLPDEYRDLDRDEARSVSTAAQQNKRQKPMPTYKGADGTYWVWDPAKMIYQGYESTKVKGAGGKLIDKLSNKPVGSWSPYDPNTKTPPWVPAGPTPAPGDINPGGGNADGKNSGGGPPPIGNPNTGNETGTGSSGGGPGGGSGVTPGSPRPYRPYPGGSVGLPVTPGSPRPYPGGSVGLRTEPSYQSDGTVLMPSRDKGVNDSPPGWLTQEDQSREGSFESNFGWLPTGGSAHLRTSDDPFSPTPDPSDRDSWSTYYDPRPSTETFKKADPFTDLFRRR